MSEIIINLNEEYKIKIENGKDFHRSFFKDIYINAAKNVFEIVSQSESLSKYDDFNNVIAFTGERGTGKSSSMISFRDSLVGNNSKEHEDFFNGVHIESQSVVQCLKKLKEKKFSEIDIIDPSLFRGKESLFEIILAKMFSKFHNSINEDKKEFSDNIKRRLIELFQEVFENLKIINGDKKDLYKQETIESLSCLASSSNLRSSFKKLLEYYLTKFEGANFLVIALDDFDLNVSMVYEMLEDIRQFLTQNKIIILVACKIDQLREAILNNLYKEFEYLLKYQSSEINELKLINKTEKYLEKVIPFEKRFELPNLKMI